MLTKRQKYYIEQFKNIERGELSWNWAAFLCAPLWLIYRKVYSGLWKILIIGFILVLVSLFIVSFVGRNVFGCSIVLWFVICGLFGNKWYYSTVKYRLAHGYHLYEGFKPTDSFIVYFSLLIWIANYSLKTHFFDLFGYILIFLHWYRDKRKVRIITKDKAVSDEDFTTENIAKLI